MKTNILALCVAVAAGLGMTACDDNWNNGNSPSEVGSVSLASLKLDINDAESLVSRADGISTDNFLVNFTNTSTGDVRKYTYGDMPEVVSMAPGEYTLSVKSHEVKSADWDAPYFLGEAKNITVEAGKITEIGTVLCKFSNIKVTVKYTTELLGYMGDDARVRVVANSKGTLDFVPTETRAGYFEAEEGSSTLVAAFQATIQGNYVETVKSFTDVKAGQHYVITFSVQNGTGTIPDEFGTIGAGGITVDADIAQEQIGGEVDVTPDKPTNPSERPGNEEWPDEPTPPVDPVDPEKPGQDDAIKVHSDYLSLDKVNDPKALAETIGDAEKGIAVVNFKVAAGIKMMKVTINSSEAFLKVLVESGLLDKAEENWFYLDNPGNKKEALEGLGLPCEGDVIDQTDVDFDITQFVPLLNIYPNTYYEFVVDVTDNDGNIKTVYLKFQS